MMMAMMLRTKHFITILAIRVIIIVYRQYWYIFGRFCKIR